MSTFNICEAKTHLSKLVDQAASGQDVIIARKGKPVARITMLEPTPPRIRFGILKGKLVGADAYDFKAPLPDDLLDRFHGEEP
jgi:prevent-host-death family protein